MTEAIDPSQFGITGPTAVAIWTGWQFLGPSIRNAGIAAGEWTDYHVRNLLRIGDAAQRKLPAGSIDAEVHPRIIHRVLSEGAWCDDSVTQEYLGGLLASAKASDISDDRMAYYVNLVANLTSDQIRIHHAVYRRLRDVDSAAFAAEYQSHAAGIEEMELHASFGDYSSALPSSEGLNPRARVTEVLVTLEREGLIGSFASGGMSVDEFDADLARCTGTPMGAQLLMAAYGFNPAVVAFGDRSVHLQEFDPPGPRITGRVGGYNSLGEASF